MRTSAASAIEQARRIIEAMAAGDPAHRFVWTKFECQPDPDIPTDRGTLLVVFPCNIEGEHEHEDLDAIEDPASPGVEVVQVPASSPDETVQEVAQAIERAPTDRHSVHMVAR